MHAARGRHGRWLVADNDNSLAHPTWRKAVASGMVLIFALTLAAMGLMLCMDPIVAP
jgi:hypothetical protein